MHVDRGEDQWNSTELEVGIAIGCSIFPILFEAACEVILTGARQMVSGSSLLVIIIIMIIILKYS